MALRVRKPAGRAHGHEFVQFHNHPTGMFLATRRPRPPVSLKPAPREGGILRKQGPGEARSWKKFTTQNYRPQEAHELSTPRRGGPAPIYKQ